MHIIVLIIAVKVCCFFCMRSSTYLTVVERWRSWEDD